MFDIKIDENKSKFYVIIDSLEAVLEYKILGDNMFDYYHIYVPTALRNRGIAAALVEFALDYAQKKGKKVKPSCPYVSAYIKKYSK
jgi:predicted GNAT family acetyltransferase